MKGKWTPNKKVWERGTVPPSGWRLVAQMASDTPNVVWRGQNINSPEYQQRHDALQKLFQDARRADNRELERLAIVEENRCKAEGIWPYIDERVTTVYNEMRKRFAESETLRKLVASSEEAAERKRIKAKPLLSGYAEVCRMTRNAEPSLTDLANNSNVSRSKWQRELREATFLLDLGKEIKKRKNLARVEASKDFWVAVYKHVEDLQGECTKRVKRSAGQEEIDENSQVQGSDRKRGGRPFLDPNLTPEAESEEN
ncbi:MAG: hypothetical protein NTZ35_02120 [Ignavibacteriales bacterium]|nr:hypothetical protein [Ignavibacteriales bacterium]